MLRTKTRKKCYIIVFVRPLINFALLMSDSPSKSQQYNKPEIVTIVLLMLLPLLQQQQRQKYRGAIGQASTPNRYRIIFYLYFTTQRRVGETRPHKCDDVTFSCNIISIGKSPYVLRQSDTTTTQETRSKILRYFVQGAPKYSILRRYFFTLRLSRCFVFHKGYFLQEENVVQLE